jgi:ABC-type multidrug transport system permease subunit
MAVILVHPTFDMEIVLPETMLGRQFLAAVDEVGTPAGIRYINPILLDEVEAGSAQVVVFEGEDGQETAVQQFSLIDSNMVKNFRNRLTAAALLLWNRELGEQAIEVVERPWLPQEIPYVVFYGMAMLPMTTFLAAVMIGGYVTAQEFEIDVVQEYRLSPVPTGPILAVRLLRLVLLGLSGAAVLLLAIGLRTAVWPQSVWKVLLILVPIAIVGGCVGMMAGLRIQQSLPAFVIGITSAFGTWILGGAFGLSAGFGRAYQLVSRLMPNTYAVELLFPQFYGRAIGNGGTAVVALFLFSLILLVLVWFTYQQQIRAQEE